MPETVTITALAHRGDGVAETPTGALYIPFTLPGETVEVDGKGERLKLRRVVEKSPLRVAPLCRHFGTCGGCALQHMERGAYSRWKHEQVQAAFASRGLAVDVAPMIAAETGDRRRAVLTAIRAGGRVLLGYHARASNQLVAITECPVLAPSLVEALPHLRRVAEAAAPKRGELRMTVLETSAGLDVTIDGVGKRLADLFPRLGQLAAEADFARLSGDGEIIIEIRPPALDMAGTPVVPAPGGFTQASLRAETAMAALVIKAVGDCKNVADLYSGLGTFALRIARQAPVLAVEGDRGALKALNTAWRRSTGLKPIRCEARDLSRRPLMVDELGEFDAVVFDPPRAGAKAQCEELAKSAVGTVVAVSCNPATLARDIRILVDGGYSLKSVQPVDQFLFSPHIEVVAVLKRE